MGIIPNSKPLSPFRADGARLAHERPDAHHDEHRSNDQRHHRDATVVVDDVTVRFGEVTALEDASITCIPGQLTAVIGANGSGKTTLLSVIAGLVQPTRGRVRIHGRSPADARARIAYVLQTTITNEAVPLTVRETVRMGRYARTGAIGRLDQADRAAIEEAIERMRLGDIAGRQLHELSGGQRQRAFVAQGLAQQADVLLLDEPITGLDLVTQEIITEVMRDERAAGRTILLTTHDIGTARGADQVVLVATRIVGIGDSAHVLTPALLDEAYGGHIHMLDDGTVVLDDPHQHGAPEQH